MGSNYFMEMAKLRAYRLLWANITNAYGLNDANNGKMKMHLTNATYNLSVYDPYVNMLRTTTSSMSAILGGADSLTVLPFDVPYETPTAFAERIARNQQLVIKEESYFDKVGDPAAGSYYIESLTDSLIKAAWELFLEIQEKGGYLEAVKQGFIQEQIKESAQKRDMQIANRREIILGTNQYPNAGEQIKQNLPADVFEADDRRSEAALVDTIATYRGAQAFENYVMKPMFTAATTNVHACGCLLMVIWPCAKPVRVLPAAFLPAQDTKSWITWVSTPSKKV